LNLVTLEKPEGHEGSVDIEKEEPANIVHKENIEKYRHSYDKAECNSQVLLFHPARWQSSMRKETSIGLIVLEIIRNSQNHQKDENRKNPNQLLMVKVKGGYSVIEQKDKINLKKHDGSHKKAR
jgi:hypothetical protein